MCQGNVRIQYASADAKGRGRLILNTQEPRGKSLRDTLTYNAIRIRSMSRRGCIFFVVCTAPDKPFTIRAVPLCHMDNTPVGALHSQLPDSCYPLTILY